MPSLSVNNISQLVNGCIANDRKSQELLYKQFFHPMTALCFRYTRSQEDAIEVFHEALLKVYKNISSYDESRSSLFTWIHTIMVRTSIDFLRKKKQKISVSIDNKPDNAESGGVDHSANLKSAGLDPEEHFIKKQKIESVRDLVNNLKPKYKEMIELFYFQEMSHEEISKKLDLPIGTIKAQLFRARDLLYNALKGSEGKI